MYAFPLDNLTVLGQVDHGGQHGNPALTIDKMKPELCHFVGAIV